MHGRGCACHGTCMCGRGVCMAGACAVVMACIWAVCGRRGMHGWVVGLCMVGEGHVWHGCGRGCGWWWRGMCGGGMHVEETVSEARSMHPTGMHTCL